MKLLVILPSTARGGTEEYALTIASAATQEHWQVYAAFPHTNGTASLVQDFARHHIHYSPLEIADAVGHGLVTATGPMLRFTRTMFLLLTLQPDVVLINLPSHHQCFASLMACGILNIPTAVVFHLFPLQVTFSSFKLKAYAWAQSRRQQWITIAKHNCSLICQTFHIPPEKVRCINNGIKLMPESTKETDHSDTLHSQLCQELGLSTSSKLLLTVARLHPQKGYSYLTPIVPDLINEFPDVKLVWVGEGDQREALMQQVEEYGVKEHVLFLGHRSDIPRLLKSANLFIFPTYFEGMPFAILEAMDCGLPIVASDAGGIPEVIENRRHGLLCRAGDSLDLLSTIRWALGHSEEMQEMARQAKQRVLEFSETKMVRDTLDELKKLSHSFD